MRKLVLWGHDLTEYCDMFELSGQDLSGAVLELGCGPTQVNAQLSQRGGRAVSCDPMFSQSLDDLRYHVESQFQFMVDAVRSDEARFNWQAYGGLDEFIAKRRQGVGAFLSDYEQGKQEGRYIDACEYDLPFEDLRFDLALCSHHLFANIDKQDVEFHVKVINELCRVAPDVRIFPLIDRYANVSELLGPVLLQLQQCDYRVEVKQVNYPLQEHGNAMLHIKRLSCDLKP